MAYLSPIQFADSNIAGTTLNGGIGSGDNTLTLTSAAVLGCPTSPSFDILIDSEFITVNGLAGNVCTPLSRGANGTTPATHANGVPVYSPITVGMINAAMARIDQANASGFQSPVFTPSGLYAAVQTTSRIVGAVAPGVGTAWTPAGGPYNVGDIVWDVSNATFYVCSVLGTPGTWIAAPSLALAQTYSKTLTIALSGGVTNLILNRTDGAAGTLVALGVQRVAATKYGLGLDGSDRFALYNAALNAVNLGVVDDGTLNPRGQINAVVSQGATPAAGGFGTVPVKFAETLLGADTASISFTSIPSTFRTIRGSCIARESTAVVSDNLLLFFNNDTAANYNDERMLSAGAASATSSEVLATAVPRLSAMPGASGTAGYFSSCSFFIPAYALATGNKIAVGTSGQSNNNVSGQSFAAVNTVIWKTTATAINRLDIKPTSNNLVTGTYVGIYLEP